MLRHEVPVYNGMVMSSEATALASRNIGSPAGVRMVALLSAAAAAYLMACGALVAWGPLPFAWGAQLLGGMETAGPVAFWAAGAVFAANAWGLAQRRSWSRRLSIALCAAGIFLAVPVVSQASGFWSTTVAGAGIAIRAAVVWYCLQPAVAESLVR